MDILHVSMLFVIWRVYVVVGTAVFHRCLWRYIERKVHWFSTGASAPHSSGLYRMQGHPSLRTRHSRIPMQVSKQVKHWGSLEQKQIMSRFWNEWQINQWLSILSNYLVKDFCGFLQYGKMDMEHFASKHFISRISLLTSEKVWYNWSA